MNSAPGILRLLAEAFKEWMRDRAEGLAASLAYYQLLSVAPVIAFVVFVSNKILGPDRLHEDVLPLLKNAFTPQLAKVILLLLSSEQGINGNHLTTMSLLSGLLLLWAGKGYFGQVKQTVETTWNKRRDVFGIKAKIGRTIKTAKIAAVAVSILILFMLLRSLLPHPYIMADSDADTNLAVIKLGQWITGFLVVSMLKIFYFTYIPPLKIDWRNTVPGAILGGILFLIGREIMEAHFRHRPDADAGESIIMVLLWFYYSGLMLIYSSEFTRLYVSEKQHIKPESLHFKP